jgi:PAS domain S-box-containing protein
MKIRTKVNLVMLVGFLSMALTMAVSVNYLGGRQLSQQGENFIGKLNDAKAHEIRTFLKSEQEVILSLSASSVFRDFLKTPESSVLYQAEKAISKTRLNRSIGSVTQIEELFLLDNKGKVVASTKPENDGKDKSQDAYFIYGQKDVFIKSLYFSSTTKTNAYAVSAPIIDDKTDELLGIVVARMYPNNLYSVVGAVLSGTQTGENFLVDSNRFVISPGRYLSQKDILTKKIDTQNARDCFSAESIRAAKSAEGLAASGKYIDYRGVAIVGAHHYIPEAGLCLITKQDVSEVLAPSFSLSLTITLLSAAILIIFLIISFFLSSRMTKRIINIKNNVQLAEKGEFVHMVPLESKDEIGDLSRSFSVMIENMEKSNLEIDRQVEKQTRDLVDKTKELDQQKSAILNVLEDAEREKQRTITEKEKISAILQSIGDGVFVVDADLNVIIINEVAAKMAGYTREEILGTKYTDKLKFVFEDSGKINDRFINKAFETKTVQEMANHTVLINKDGRKTQVADSAAPLLDKDGKVIGCVVVFRDVTVEREIDKQKTEFVSLASHQLKTPIGSIQWDLEMLLAGDYGPVSEKQKDILNEAYSMGKRMNDLVNSLLNISRIEMGSSLLSRNQLISQSFVTKWSWRCSRAWPRRAMNW